MRIAVPVKCQNGHTATEFYQWDRWEHRFRYEGVPSDQACDCPKWNIGQGWTVDGEPQVVTE
jgi:hypothetical protein